MINQLEKALSRLQSESRADAVVLWATRSNPPGASVLTSFPPGLLPAGTEWPVTDGQAPAGRERDPAGLAAVVPTTLRLRLPQPPVAAQSFALGTDLFLLLVWCDPAVPDEISDILHHLIRNELSYLAQLVEASRFNQGEVERLLAVLNALDEGVVSIDPHLGQANVNNAASALLDLPGGQVAAADFAAAMGRLGDRAVNHDEAAAAVGELRRDPAAEIDTTWRFAGIPSHLRVRSIAVRRGEFTGRIWTFIDESGLAQALEQSEQSRSLVQASSDAMIDPQVVLRMVKDPSGRVVDMVYLDLNRATCAYLGLSREELLAKSALDHMPNLEGSGLLARYARCAETGEPVILDDFSYFNEVLEDDRRYDIRATRVRPGVLNLTWRDVTDRFHTAQRIARSEERYRLLADNVGDVVVRIADDGEILWVSNAIEEVMGAPAQRWIGRNVEQFVPPAALDSHRAFSDMAAQGTAYSGRAMLVDGDGTTHWIQLHLKPFYDSRGVRDGLVSNFHLIDDEVAAEARAEEARAAQAAADALYRKSVDSAAVGMCLADTVGNFIDVNQAMCDFFGYPATVLKTKTWMELTAPDYLQADIDKRAEVMAGRIDTYRMVKQFIHSDGRPIWGDLSIGCLRTPDGQVEVFIGQINDITAEVQARRELETAQALRAEADARYRRLMQSSTIGMTLITPDGRFDVVNPALCRFFGYGEGTLRTKSWQELTAADYLEADLGKVEDVLAGRIDSYRMTKQYVHADGHLIWGDLAVSCLRDAHGQVERFVSQIVDITAEVEARNQVAQRDLQNQVLNRRLQAQTNRMKSELDSAASYVASLLPGELTGAVQVSSSYLPSRELGGDCFGYSWVDDDHLIVYLIDVSGHGIAPALLSISVLNMLRSESLPRSVLFDPARLLGELNSRFQMDEQDSKYFTVFYGVYHRPSRRLRFASAGHPPALAFPPGGEPMRLSTPAAPIGMFDDSSYTSDSYLVPTGTQLLIYSDGAFELPLPGGRHGDLDTFVGLCTEQAAEPDWGLERLTANLLSRTAGGQFEDDCSLILLRFD